MDGNAGASVATGTVRLALQEAESVFSLLRKSGPQATAYAGESVELRGDNEEPEEATSDLLRSC